MCAFLLFSDWFLFSCMVAQRRLITPSYPLPKIRINSRKEFYELSKEEQDKLRIKINAFHDGVFRIVKDMPAELYFIFRLGYLR